MKISAQQVCLLLIKISYATSVLTWVGAAFLSLVFQCLSSEANRVLQLPSGRLNAWRAFFTTLFLLPFVFYFEWSENPWFYIAAIFSGVAGITFSHFLKTSAKLNGRAANMYKPPRIFLMFIGWVIIDSQQLVWFVDHPLRATVVILSLFLIMGSLFFLRRNPVGWKTLLHLLPMAIFFAVDGIISKLVIDPNMLLQNIIVYIFLSALLTFFFQLIWLQWHKPKRVLKIDKDLVKGSFIIALLGLGAYAFGLAGYVLAPNPAYASALTLLVPIVLMGYHKCVGIKDDASPMVGVVMVVAAIMLVIVTTH